MQIEGRTALITGGGTGMGAAIAQRFVDEGAMVVITGRREALLKSVCESIRDTVAIRHFVADVSDRSQVNNLVHFACKEFGPVNILINNAGINVPKRRLGELDPQAWDAMMDINATGAFNLIHALLPQMRERKDGVIINISSIAGMRASVLGGAAYSASKHAMAALTKVLSLELKDEGIRACTIYPGEVDTPLLDDRPDKVTDEHRATMLRPEDIAETVLFVAALPPHVNISDLVIKPTTQAFA